jgi:hypothetical protein
LGSFVDDPDGFVAGTLHRSLGWFPERDLVDLADPERLWQDLLTRAARTPEFRLVRDGATVPSAAYCRTAGVGHRTIDDVVQPNRVLELHAEGATVVIQGLQLTDPHLARVANNLALALDQPVQVNAYLSPPSARGLDLHVDLHDVFVVQLDGAKRWRVWEPLPRTVEPIKGGPPVAKPTFDELGRPELDTTLRCGDVLYLPRGHPHCAETVDDASAHLTVGILAITWQRLLRKALDTAVADGHWRSSVRLDQILRGSVVDAAAVGETLATHLDVGDVRRWLAHEVWRRQPATRLRPRRPPSIGDSTPLTVTPGPLIWLDGAATQCTLGLGDRQLLMPPEAHPFLAQLLSAPSAVPISALSGLDDASKRVVVDRLVVEGVVAPG